MNRCEERGEPVVGRKEEKNLETYIVKRLTKLGLTVTTVESCTGGMIAAALTSVSGSSEVFRRGFVTYCDEAKHEMVGVKKKTLKKYTAVSSETAAEMAEGGARAAKADCCVSVTGYAGPATSDSQEPVGLVYIGCSIGGKTKVKELHLQGDRAEIRAQARDEALRMLKKSLDKKYRK